MLRNVGYGFVANAWLFVLTVVATPILIDGMGPRIFGVYALVATLAGYFAVLDLGLGVATIRYVAECQGRGDTDAMSRLIGTALAVYLALGVGGALVLSLGASFLVEQVLNVPNALGHTARVAVLITAVGMLVTVPLSILTAIPTALQRMDITNRRNVVFGTATIGGSLALVASGHDIVAVLTWAVLLDAIAAVSFAATVRHLLPGISLRPRLDRVSLRSLGGFGFLKCLNQIATYAVYHLDKLIIAALAPVAAVTNYVVALALTQRTTQLVGIVSGAFLPAASEVHGRDDRERVLELYVRASKLVALMVFPLGAVLVIFADPLLTHWIGGSVAGQSVGLLRILALGYTVNALSTIPATACDSLGRPGVTTAFSGASAALNVCIALLLIPRLGAMGAAVAVLVNSVILVPWFLIHVHRRVLSASVTDLVRRALLRPALATLAIMAPAQMLARRVHGVPSLLLALGATGALYLVVTVTIGAYDAADRALLNVRLHRRETAEATQGA